MVSLRCVLEEDILILSYYVLVQPRPCFFYQRILYLLLIILDLEWKGFISASPRMQWYCRLVMKKNTMFWTHKFAVGLTDMGNSESQDPGAPICKRIMAQVDTSRRNWTIVDRDIKINSNKRKLNV